MSFSSRARHVGNLVRNPVLARRAIQDRRWQVRVATALARDLRPPPPSTFASFGGGSVIVPPARVTHPECIHIGSGVTLLEHAWLSVVEAIPGVLPRLEIGDGTSIGRFAHIACVGEIVIGSDVQTSERVFIGDTYHDYTDVTQPVLVQPLAAPEPVRIEDGAFVGIGATILMGVTIGKGAYVGAGAVVTRSVPPNTVVAGNPAQVIRRYDGERGWIRPT